MKNLELSNYKSQNNKTKYLNNTWRDRSLKIKKNFLELKNDFIGLKDGELKDRELITIKNSRNVCSLLCLCDIDRFEEKKMEQKSSIKKQFVQLVD